MPIEQVTEDILYVRLPKTPHLSGELEPVNDLLSSGRSCDVILDFNYVDVITSSSISSLLILQNLLNTHNRQLILCDVTFLTKCIFTTTGLAHYFHFTDNKDAALQALHHNAKSL